MLSQALRTIVPELDALEVSYALIGALALAPYNVVRATKDVDFLIGRSITEIAGLAAQFGARGFRAVARKGSPDDPLAGVLLVEVPTDSGAITCDLIFPTRGWQVAAIRNAISVEMEGLTVRVVQARDLFLLKLGAGGPQDLLDAADLLRMQSLNQRAAWERAASRRHLADACKRCWKFMK